MKSKKWIELFFKFWSFFSWAVLQVRVTPSKINGVCHDPAQKPVPNPNLCSPALSTEPGPRWTSPGGALGCSLLFPVPFQMLPITSLCVTTAEWRESCPWWGTVKHRALSAPLHSSNHIFLFPPRFPARASVGGVAPVCPVCWDLPCPSSLAELRDGEVGTDAGEGWHLLMHVPVDLQLVTLGNDIKCYKTPRLCSLECCIRWHGINALTPIQFWSWWALSIYIFSKVMP